MKTLSKQFKEVETYLHTFIPKTNMNRFPGEYGLKRTQKLLELLGNPQEKIKVIHIAGTSGKGSTATALSSLLHAHGFKTGLHIKPHLLDIRERFQINNSLVSEEVFIQYFKDVKKAISLMTENEYGLPTYFEVVVSLAFYIFYKEKVDYAVIETGLGGLYDGSNVIENPNKLVLLAKIGFDHMAILGNSLKEIAYQKAMIMQKGNDAISINQEPDVEAVFKEVASKQGANLLFLQPENYDNVKVSNESVEFDFKYKDQVWNKIKLHMLGDFQAQNATLALAALLYLSQRDHFDVEEVKVRKILSTLTYPGRFEIKEIESKTVVIDGAHNVQKMTALLSNLSKMFPGEKFTFAVAFKEDKEIEAMVQLITPVAEEVIVTSYFNDTVDFVTFSEKPQVVVNLFRKCGCKNVTIEEDSKKVLNNLIKTSTKVAVVTGSLYLISDIYPTLQS